MDNDKRNKLLVLSIIILSLVVIMGVGYAFFSASVSNANKETVTAGSASLALEFDDNDNGVSGTLNLGQSITKKFTLENLGTVDTYAKINWLDLVNTYLPGSLTYNLEQSTSENGTYTSIKTGNVPVSNSATTAVLKNGILVPVSTMYYYKLTITLNNFENVNQNSDITANFHSYFNLQEGSLTGADTIENLVAGEPTNTTAVITKTAPSGATCTNTLAYDGTTDNNLRYVGKNPCNYVMFNGEVPRYGVVYRAIGEFGSDVIGTPFESLEACNEARSTYDICTELQETISGWRIIGVMNNVDDGTGNLETRIKLIRGAPLGKIYAWDSSAVDVNEGKGINDWTQADLMRELNGDYLDTTLSTNTYWYNGNNNVKTGEYDYTKGLKADAQELIGNAKWYLGGFDNIRPNSYSKYLLERGTEVWGSRAGQTCNDGACPRATSWIGKVALTYPSDYDFATAGNNRNSCLEKLSDASCSDSNWLFMKYITQGQITPSSSSANYTTGIYQFGGLAMLSSGSYIRPTIYLQSNVKITGGSGTEDDPYILG